MDHNDAPVHVVPDQERGSVQLTRENRRGGCFSSSLRLQSYVQIACAVFKSLGSGNRTAHSLAVVYTGRT